MKRRNIYLGLKDQMPLKRLIRNLIKGHVLGLFHKRSHYRMNGSPKVSYKTKETAVRVANQMSEKKGVHFSNYKCIFCDGYHLGKNRENKNYMKNKKNYSDTYIFTIMFPVASFLTIGFIGFLLVTLSWLSSCDNNQTTANFHYVKNLQSKTKDAGMFANYLNKNYQYNREPKYLATAWVAFKKEHPEVKTSFKTITKMLDFQKIKISKQSFGGGTLKKDDGMTDDDFINVWMFIVNINMDNTTNTLFQTEEQESLTELENTGVEQAEVDAETGVDAESDAGDGGDGGGDGGDGGGDGGGD